MTTLTIEIPDKVEKTLADLVKQLGGKVIMTDTEKKVDVKLNQVEKNLSRKEKEFLKGFDDAIEFVNLHQQGKVKAGKIDELLNEL